MGEFATQLVLAYLAGVVVGLFALLTSGRG